MSRTTAKGSAGKRAVCLNTCVDLLFVMGWLPTIFQEAGKKFPSLGPAEAIISVHTVGMMLNLSYLPDFVIHVSGFGREDGV